MSDNLRYADFLFWEKDWLYRQFFRLEILLGHRYCTLKSALGLFLQNDGEIIVETGTQRVIDDPGGCSTLLFGAICKRYGKRLFTVDNNATHIETSKQATREYKEHITYVLMDSVKFLREFNEKIDFLYLDSMDCPYPPLPATESQMHNLNELKAAYNNLHKGSILLIDDNNYDNGGKSKLSKQFLLETGEWHCILDYAQTLWVKVK